jgi:hypothetical protein
MDFHGTPGNDTIDQDKQSLPADTTIYGDGGDDSITLSNGKAIGGPGNNVITGTGPRAVAVYWDAPAGVNVNLQTGVVSNGWGGTDKLVNIQQVFGSSHNDVLVGNAANNVFVGIGGSDKFVGGGGSDTVSYFFVKSTDAKVSYDAATDTFTVVKNFANDKGTDTLTGINAIQFSGDGSDNQTIYRSDYTSTVKYSLAGVWNAIPAGGNAAVIGPFHAQLPLGAAQKNGMVLGGWAYQGGFGGTGQPLTVNAAMLEQQADGSLKLATGTYLPASATQGVGSVNIADFNGDGRPDIFMAAHNESPFVAVPSVAFMSNAAGTFERLVLDDKVMAHDAELGYVNGVPTIMTRTFNPGDMNPSYQYVNGKFVETIEGKGVWSSGGMSIAMADFDGNGVADVVVGDFDWGPGYPKQAQGDHWRLAVYNWNDLLNNTGAPKALLETYFTGKPAYANIPSLDKTPGVAHVPRLWVDDFNHDGKPDILANAGLWSENNPSYPTVLQMLQNKGNFQFTDRTDALNPDVSKAIDEFDYSMQRLDLDHSGILSYLSGKGGGFNADGSSRAANYVLVNDGTGRLYVALHDEFTEWEQGVHQYLSRSSDLSASGIGVNAQVDRLDAFLPYQAADGTLNFVDAMQVDGGREVLTNVMAHYNVSTDFKKDIAIADRNDSKLMRTFAGNDSLSDLHANGATHFDGGAGTDTANYSGKFMGYQLARLADGSYTVSGGGTGGVPQVQDTLANVERIKFADASIALFNAGASAYKVTRDATGAVTLTGAAGTEVLQKIDRVLFADSAIAFDTAGNAGQAFRIYQAAFNRVPDKAGLGYWISAMDHGTSLNSVAAGFVNSAEFRDVYGANPTSTEIVSKIYQNVLHRPGEDAGIKFWAGALDGKSATVAEVLAGFSESPENQAALIGATANGIAYQPFF